MYVDNAKEIALTMPGAGVAFTLSTNNINLKDGADGLGAWIPGEGERVYMQFETVTPFVDAGGAEEAVFNLGIIASTAADLTANARVLVQTAGYVNLAVANWAIGMTAAQFVSSGWNAAGNHFELEIPGYIIDRLADEFQTLIHIGVIAFVPNYYQAGVGFSAGSLKARIVKDLTRDPLKRVVRPRMIVA